MDDARKIANGLTKARQDAVCGRYSWASPWDQDDGEQDLYDLGLWKPGRLKRGESILTPLGQQVRAVLMEMNDGE
jgi:hypothetical protein